MQDVPHRGDLHLREAEQLSKLPQGVGRPLRPQDPRRHRQAGGDGVQGLSGMGKVVTDTNMLDLRTRYRTKLGWFFWF